MWKYVLKRVILAFITAFIILSLTFILMKLLPFTKPLGTYEEQFSYYMQEYLLGYLYNFNQEMPQYGEYLFKYQNKATLEWNYFYQVPVFEQYFKWLGNIILHWDWGTSVKIAPNLKATTIIMQKLPTSMKLNIISTLVAVPLGITFGIIAALKKNKPTDHVISTVVMVLISIPSFILITFLLLFLCYGNQWLPTKWPASTSSDLNKFLGYIIPVTALSLGSIAGYTRFTRAELCEVMSSEYLLLARTKGLTKRQAILRHALRNAMVPIVPSILAEFLSIMGGSMILEQLYGIPGIGSLFVESMNGKDYNVLFVDMAIFTTFGLLAGVLLDVSYGFIDPRIRMGAKK